MGPPDSPAAPDRNGGGGGPPLNIDLKDIDPHKLDILDERCRGDRKGGVVSDGFLEPASFTPPRGTTSVTSVTPVPHQRGDQFSGAVGINSSRLSLTDAFDKHSNANNASNASCQTVKHENIKAIRASTSTATTTAAATNSKKKSKPSKRPVSSIGDRLPHTSPIKRSRKGDAASNGPKSRQRTKKTDECKPSAEAASSVTQECANGDNATSKPLPATPLGDHSSKGGGDQTSRSESRDLYSYFGTNGSASNHGSSDPACRPSAFSSPTVQSKAVSHKEKIGGQRTLHGFLGINKKDEKKQQSIEDEGKKEDQSKSTGSAREGVISDAIAGVSASSSGSSSKPASDSRTKRKRASLKGSNSTTSSITDASLSEQSLHEIKRLQHQLSSLQKQLDDANARNNSIKNNQTLISANLQRQLKHQKAEMQTVQRENAARMNKAMDVMERLVRDESVREAEELRQKLASDGARLGRLVSSRVAGGMGGMRSQTIESWEDGHAPKLLKSRKAELRKRREELERRRGEIAASAGANASNDPARNGDSGLSGDGETSNSKEAGAVTNDLDLMEAHETIRMHLDEARVKEMEIDGEERAMNVEKRGHVRALKLVLNEDTSKFRVRRKLHDRYVLLNLLGKGGFSEVWRAFDLHDMRHVAVKIHQLESGWSDAKKENYTKHVSREYEIHREVRHPRIVSLFDVFEIDTDSFATVLECCKGTDLDTLLKDRGRLLERDARAILLQILSGMRYLSAPSADGRRQGIIHYDLKPGNILFDEHGNAKITDFGLSKIVDNSLEEGDSMELTSQGAGTYWYLPPECFLMDQDVRISNKVDVWSIGVIYFQMLYGRRPFGDGQSQDHILRNQTMLHATEVHFPSKPLISAEGKAFIQDCLTYDQMSRPSMGRICEHGYLKPTTTL